MISKYRGCLFGLAIGDALGAPVEFLTLEQIKEHYGENGISDFHPRGSFKAGSYTDDTQMSLATAVGCIRAYQRWKERGICHPPSVVYRRYLEWLETQNDHNQRRSPGNTCLSALQSGDMGSIKRKINDSKGCGGVMRVAPVGLSFSVDRAFEGGAEIAAITHGNPSGYLPAGFLAEMIAHLIKNISLEMAVQLSMETLTKHKGHEQTLKALEHAVELLAQQEPVEKSIKSLGEGWVGEEALAISIYCSLKFSKDWRKGTLAAINHSGDSDSTGAITGAILGTSLGVESIPDKWVHNVENASMIQKIADDMFRIFRNKEELSFTEYPPN